MEAIQAGWLSILPPVIAIVLAFVTKEVISSLMLGILSGSLIYAALTHQGFLMVGAKTIETAFSTMGGTGGSVSKFNILLFLSLLGALVVVVTKAGGSKAYGVWAANKLRSPQAAQLATSALGALIFIDDYFNCLTVGTVMKPVTDKYGVSREKLAYLIDATAAPICIIAPVSSWAAAIGSSLSVTGQFESDLAAFVATIPFNFYALLSLVMVVGLAVLNLDFGPMEKAQYRAKTTGDLGMDATQEEMQVSGGKGRVYDLVIPVAALIVFSILAMLYTGGYFTQADVTTLQQAFGNCDSSASLVMGGFGALVVAFLLFVPRKLLSFKDFMGSITEGVKSMASANIILVLAWTLGAICSDVLNTGEYVKTVVLASNFPIAIIPAVIFAVAAFLSFSTGTAWGTFGILIPIVVEICASAAPQLLVVALAATLAGSVFGDHCSPISDTTILSSTGAGCNHLAHVSTQMPYALLVAGCSFVGYLVAGFTNANLLLSLGTAVLLLVAVTVALHRMAVRKEVKR